jgi:AcrR family transcriptional regulator
MRKGPRQDRAQQTVEAILRATAHILVRYGYEGANTNRIAGEAGVSIGSLYQYFPNKESLVAALIERHCEQMWQVTLEGLASAMAMPVPQAAAKVIGAILAAHGVEPKLHKVLREQVPRVGKLGMMEELTTRCAELVKAYLEAHREEILPRDIPTAAWIVVQTVEALAHASLGHPELQDEITALVVRYLQGSPLRVQAAG